MRISLFTLCLYLWMFSPDLKLQNERFVVSRNFLLFPDDDA